MKTRFTVVVKRVFCLISYNYLINDAGYKAPSLANSALSSF
jgi:hypothetical protein